MVYLYSPGQDLKNTEWIKIKVEREDGSTLIDRKESIEDPLQYYFLNDSVYFSSDHQYSTRLTYSLTNGVLSIGNFAKYKVDSLDEKFLIISQLNDSTPQNRLNRYYFINSVFLFDYLRREQKLPIVDDSQIECNNLICPTFSGSMFDLFGKQQFNPVYNRKLLYGYFIIDSVGRVVKSVVDSSKNFTKTEIKKIIEVVSSTSGSWILPPAPNSIQFKIKYAFEIAPLFFEGMKPSAPAMSGFQFQFFPGRKRDGLSTEEQIEAGQHINEGIRLCEKQDYEKAILQFKRCISIDSLYIDAYYDLGYAYQKSGKNELACEVWKKLTDMNQKQGEAMYHQYCK